MLLENIEETGKRDLKVVKDFVRPPSGKGASVALGLFDGLHIGHRQVLEAALHSGELAPCVFTYTISSQIPQNKKNYSTLMPDEQKCALLEQMGFEMVVMPEFDSFKDVEPREFVERMLIEGMGARELSCGYDFTFGRRERGTPVCCPRWQRSMEWDSTSSSRCCSTASRSALPASVRQSSTAGWMMPSRMLGRRFCIRLKVEHGNQIGRMLDFPTINQVFPRFHIVPRYGVILTSSTSTVSCTAGDQRRCQTDSRVGRSAGRNLYFGFQRRFIRQDRRGLFLSLCPPGAALRKYRPPA